jgi:hypothetical protein
MKWMVVVVALCAPAVALAQARCKEGEVEDPATGKCKAIPKQRLPEKPGTGVVADPTEEQEEKANLDRTLCEKRTEAQRIECREDAAKCEKLNKLALEECDAQYLRNLPGKRRHEIVKQREDAADHKAREPQLERIRVAAQAIEERTRKADAEAMLGCQAATELHLPPLPCKSAAAEAVRTLAAQTAVKGDATKTAAEARAIADKMEMMISPADDAIAKAVKIGEAARAARAEKLAAVDRAEKELAEARKYQGVTDQRAQEACAAARRMKMPELPCKSDAAAEAVARGAKAVEAARNAGSVADANAAAEDGHHAYVDLTKALYETTAAGKAAVDASAAEDRRLEKERVDAIAAGKAKAEADRRAAEEKRVHDAEEHRKYDQREYLRAEQGRRRKTGILIGTIGVVIMGAGAVFLPIEQGQYNSIQQGGLATSADIRSALDKAHLYDKIAIGGFAVGGAVLLFGAIKVGLNPDPGEYKMQLAATATPSFAGLVLSGTFK